MWSTNGTAIDHLAPTVAYAFFALFVAVPFALLGANLGSGVVAYARTRAEPRDEASGRPRAKVHWPPARARPRARRPLGPQGLRSRPPLLGELFGGPPPGQIVAAAPWAQRLSHGSGPRIGLAATPAAPGLAAPAGQRALERSQADERVDAAPETTPLPPRRDRRRATRSLPVTASPSGFVPAPPSAFDVPPALGRRQRVSQPASKESA